MRRNLTVYRRKNDVIQRDVAGETLLVPIHGKVADMQNLYVLEGVGKFVWERLDGSRTYEEIRNAVVARFEVTADQADGDLAAFIAQFKQAGLLAEETRDDAP